MIGSIDAVLTNIRQGDPALLDPDNYTGSQAFAREAKATGSDGIIYPSVRNLSDRSLVTFYPDVTSAPVQGRHLSYHWDREPSAWSRI